MILGLALVALSLPASATQYKVVCCNGTTQYINSVSFQAIRQTGYMTWEEFHNILTKEGERLCSDHCVRSVFEDTSLGLLGFITSMLENNRERTLTETDVHKETAETWWSWKPGNDLY